jgi:choline dehydrogenase-like flavoprotein
VRIEAAALPSGAKLQAEVAIVGAGPVGIVLALELAEAGHRVLLIESGSDSFSATTQRLADTAGDDPAHAPISLTMRRQIGGTSNLWAGRCVPFDPVDFQARAITGAARWPVSYQQLEPYFTRACDWFVCGAPSFDASELPSLAGRSLVPGWPEGDVRSTALERWSLPTNFGRRYGGRLRDSPSITLVTGLTCTEISCAADGASVAHLIGQTLAGNRVSVHAARYVLACGGLEVTRLLFASNRVHPNGIGNHSGHLGHWYMGHVEARIARINFATRSKRITYGYERDCDGVYVRRRFTFTSDFLIEHELPNVALWLTNPELGDPSHRSGVLSLVYLLLVSPIGGRLISEAIRQGQIKTEQQSSNWDHLANVLRELGPAATFALGFGYRRFLQRGHKAPGVFVPSPSNVYTLNYHGEHLPHYASYVAPTEQRDALGMPRLRTALRFDDSDVENVIRVHALFDRYLRENRLGYLDYLSEDPRQTIRNQLFGGYHQAGTTRMSERPKDGVLDPTLAVHGFDDLFVASSSAFVTSSQANTTFMIVVFALRLAELLDRSLR